MRAPPSRCLLLALSVAAVGATAATATGSGGGRHVADAGGALYYKLDGSELANATAWPADFLKYSVLVVNPGLAATTLAQIRRDLPGRQLVAYTCMAWAYVSQPCTNCTPAAGAPCVGCPGGRCVDVVDPATNASYWNNSWNLQNLHDGKAVCPFDGVGAAPSAVAAWIPSAESTAAMAHFHAAHTAAGYDGVYVDDFMPEFYAAWATYAQVITSSADPAQVELCAHVPVSSYGRQGTPGENCSSFFGAAGDGTTNSSLPDLQAQFSAWRPMYTAKLRQALGDGAVIIANVPVPHNPDPNLNGVTVEFEHCKGDESPHATAIAGDGRGSGKDSSGGGDGDRSTLSPACAQTLLGQKALSDFHGRPSVFALWLTHSEVVPAATQCAQLQSVQEQMGAWVREGDDITDCTRETGPASCVRCNHTALPVSATA